MSFFPLFNSLWDTQSERIFLVRKECFKIHYKNKHLHYKNRRSFVMKYIESCIYLFDLLAEGVEVHLVAVEG